MLNIQYFIRGKVERRPGYTNSPGREYTEENRSLFTLFAVQTSLTNFSVNFLSQRERLATHGSCERKEDKNFRIHLIPMRHFYVVQLFNNSVKSIVIFHKLFQSEEETVLL